MEVASVLGKFQVFDFRFSLTPEFFSRTYSFWAGLIGGAFLTTASHGTEQLMVQRLLGGQIGDRKPLGALRQLDRDRVSIHAVSVSSA